MIGIALIIAPLSFVMIRLFYSLVIADYITDDHVVFNVHIPSHEMSGQLPPTSDCAL